MKKGGVWGAKMLPKGHETTQPPKQRHGVGHLAHMGGRFLCVNAFPRPPSARPAIIRTEKAQGDDFRLERQGI